MRRDFSESSKQNLLNLVSQVENEKLSDFTDWIGDRWYDYRSLIGKLRIKNYIDNVNEYHKKVIDKNNTTKVAIEQIFTQVNTLDAQYSNRLAGFKSTLQELQRYIHALSEIVEPVNVKFNVDTIHAELISLLSELTFDDMLMPPEYVMNNASILGNNDITSDFLEGRSQGLDIFASAWSADWMQNALALIGIGENANEEMVRKSIETLIATTLKDKHKVTDFTEDCTDALTPEELKDFKKVIDYTISVGRTLTEAEIADLLGIDVRQVVESDYLQFILAQRNLDTITEMSEVLDGTVGKYFEFVDAIDITTQIIGKLVNDYTEDLRMLEYIKAAMIDQGYDQKVVNDTIARLEWEYKDNAGSALVTGLNKLVEEGVDMTFELISKEVSSLLTLFLTTKDIGCEISGLSGQTENLEMIYTTQQYSYALIEKYDYYANKIRSGVYTQEDIDNCKIYFDLARNAKIQEYEAIINLYEEALETVDIDMFSSVPDMITAMTASEEEIQAVKNQIDALEDEIERLKGLDSGPKLTSDDLGIKAGAVAGGGGGAGGR